MQWRTIIIGTIAGAAAVWLWNRNRGVMNSNMLPENLQRVSDRIRTWIQKPVQNIMPDGL